MCNLYSLTKGQAAIRQLTRAVRDATGNLAPMPGVFPGYPASIVRLRQAGDVAKLQLPLPDASLTIVARGEDRLSF
jgi:putative SOS response-associated peptidase YedK